MPVGSFNDTLKSLTAAELLTVALKHAFDYYDVPLQEDEEISLEMLFTLELASHIRVRLRSLLG